MIDHFEVNVGGNVVGGDAIEPERSSTIRRSGGSPRLTTPIISVWAPQVIASPAVASGSTW